MAARRRDLRGEPAAEREAEQGDLVAQQRVECGEVEMYQIVDRVEILGPRRLPEARGGGRDYLALPAEQIEKRCRGVDRIEAVQHQDRTPGAASQHFKLDPLHRQPLGLSVRARHRTLLADMY